MEEETDAAARRACPYCGEQILAVAIKCKHCASMLDGSHALPRAKQLGEVLGIVMLVLPICAAVLVWFWVGSMNLFQGPMSTLAGILVVTVVATAVLGAVEASQLGFVASSTETSPIGWFFFILLFWVIGYPAYLFRRSRHGAKNLVVGGTLSAVLLVGVVVLMYGRIYATTADIDSIRNAITRDEPTPTVPTPTVPTPPTTSKFGSPGASTEQGTIGIAECDQYVRKMGECADRMQPEAAVPMKNLLEEMRTAWKEAALTPSVRSAVTANCMQARDAARTAFGPLGCAF